MNTSNEEVRQRRETQGLLQTVFEHSQDAILIADDKIRYVDGNPAACALLGVTAEELRALRVLDILEPVSITRTEHGEAKAAPGGVRWRGCHISPAFVAGEERGGSVAVAM